MLQNFGLVYGMIQRFHKSFLYLSLRFQLRCVLVLEEKIAGQAIILHRALKFTYLVLVGRKRTQTTVRKE